VVHPADVQDRDGAVELLRRSRRRFPFVERIFADGGYQGPKMAAAVANTGAWKLEIVKRTDLHRFVSSPGDGSSNGPSRGSAETDASRATSNATQEPSPPSYASP
jgi:transposase